MKKFNKKVVKVLDEAKDLVEKILRWRNMELDRILHVKYEPHKASGKSHFEAIMADVQEGPEKVEEILKIQELAEGLAGRDLLSFDDIDLSYDEKARIEHKKKLERQKEIQAFVDMKNKR